MSIVSTVPDNDRSHIPSPDVPRKPDISTPKLAGLRLDDAFNPTDTDDSSSSNSPTRQSRRYSAWDSHTQSSASPVFAGHGPAPLFLREIKVSKNSDQPNSNGKNVLAPAPFFLWAGASSDCLTRASNDGLLHSVPASNVPDIVVLRDPSPVPDEMTQLERSQTPRQTEGPIPPNEPIMNMGVTNSFVEPESAQTPFAPATLVSPATQSLPSSNIQDLYSTGTQPATALPPPFRVATERGLRLSPSIVSRHRMPILNLPTLPVSTPPETAVRPVVRLQHVPSLSVHGRPDVDPEPDSAIEYEDDDDVEDDNEGDEDEGLRNEDSEHQSDEDGDGEELPGLDTGRSLSHSPLREFQTQVTDLVPPVVGHASQPIASSSLLGVSTPVPHSTIDYFSSKAQGKLADLTPRQDASTPRPFSPKAPLAESINVRRRITPTPSLYRAQPSLEASLAPTLSRAPSRSMIDLSVSQRDLRKKSRDTVHSNVPSVSGNTIESVESDNTDNLMGRLMRRTSMPTFTSASDPPPYPSFDPRPPKSAPPFQFHEDEGRERLPPYSNSLYLSAIMPLKMEFSSPGVQAKDRKWRRVFCELEGTTLRIYKCPPGASGAGIIGEWWERRVGVGDLSSGYHAPTRKADKSPAPSSKRRDESPAAPSKIAVDQPVASSSSSPPPTPHRPRSESQSSRATNQSTTPSISRANRRLSGASFLTPWRNSGPLSGPQSRGRGMSSPGTNGGMELLPVSEPNSRRNSVSSSASQETTSRRTSPLTQRAPSRLSFLSSRMQLRSGEIQKPGKGDLIRAYTLQHAESGLGNDYLKRKNVIRVRLEGEQFLLQAADVPSVVEWIEVGSKYE